MVCPRKRSEPERILFGEITYSITNIALCAKYSAEMRERLKEILLSTAKFVQRAAQTLVH